MNPALKPATIRLGFAPALGQVRSWGQTERRSLVAARCRIPAGCLVLAGALAAAAWAVHSGCGGKGGGGGNGNNTNECPAGFQRSGPSCVPVFDDCPGPAEIPVAGGGCLEVGVTRCATGFVSDGQGGCDPVLPDEPCPPGSMAALGQTECQPVGIDRCGAGFVPDGHGGCIPVLPAIPCGSGTMEMLGLSECQPIGDCGSDTWGNIATDATTVYVDGDHGGSNSDGSRSAPFVTVAEALGVVEPGGQIAVAAGEYVERLVIAEPLELAGRCARQVTLRGTLVMGQPAPPIRISTSGSGTAIRGVTLTGPGEGISVEGARNVTIEDSQVIQTGSSGIAAYGNASVRLNRVAVRNCSDMGVHCQGSTVELAQCVVADTEEDPQAGGRGWGVTAWCSPGTGECGTLTVTQSLVAGNTDVGVLIMGTDAVVRSSVVRNTRPEGNGAAGWGIAAQCDPDVDVCGSVTVDQSLVAGNREVGIRVSGAHATVLDTVVEGTLPRQDNALLGWGINAECSSGHACGSMTVARSLIRDNSGVGILIRGADTDIQSTVVRNTHADGDGLYGRGLEAACHQPSGSCGTLKISESLIAGNRDAGVVVSGVEADIRGSVVRDTEPQQADNTKGRGINAHCSAVGNTCGTLTVAGSLIDGNMDHGIAVFGVDAFLLGAVIRNTRPQRNSQEFGRGINVQCDHDARVCGILDVTGSVIDRSSDVGVMIMGADANVESTVVRNTSEGQSNGLFGRGIDAQCDPDTGQCGSLSVVNCLVKQNKDSGIIVHGTPLNVDSTVVRDTQSQEYDGKFGRGIDATCDPGTNACGGLTVAHSLVSSNRDVGINALGVDVSIVGTVVRETRMQTGPQMGGEGISVRCHHEVGQCGSLAVALSLVESSREVGIAVFGPPAILNGVAVKNTRPNEEGPLWDRHGEGVFSTCDPETGDCGTLQVTHCLIESNYTAGLAVKGAEGFIQYSMVAGVDAQPLGASYGYGIQVEGTDDFELLAFDVRSCRILDAFLAGILFHRAMGKVSGTEVSGGRYAVAANVGSRPELGEDNTLAGTERNGLFWGNMEPVPAPAPALPQDVTRPGE